jgi:hypothetical protein
MKNKFISLVTLLKKGYMTKLKNSKLFFKYFKEAFKFRVKLLKQKGIIYYSIQSIDCDMVESYRVYKSTYFKKLKDWDDYVEKTYVWAEGPTSIEMLTKEEYELALDQEYSRDRIMEAYENGHGSSIIV